MRGISALAVTPMAVAILLSGGLMPVHAASAAPASGTPVAMGQNDNGRMLRPARQPARLNIMIGGPNLYVTGLRWQAWTGDHAAGTGSLIGEDRGVYHLGRVTLWLYHPVTGRGHRYFGYLHVSGGQDVAHDYAWSWADGGMWLASYLR